MTISIVPPIRADPPGKTVNANAEAEYALIAIGAANPTSNDAHPAR